VLLYYYKLITQFAGERIFFNGEHLAKLGTKYLFHAPHLPCTFVRKDAERAK